MNKLFLATIIVFFGIFAILSGCATSQQSQPASPGVEEITIKTVYICPDGSETQDKSSCVLPAACQSNTTAQPGTVSPSVSPDSAKSCGGEQNVSCPSAYYCNRTSADSLSTGTCAKMVPVGLSISPPSAYYDYVLGGAWTGSFTVMNTGNTPITLTFDSNSEYLTVASNSSVYLEPDQRTTVKYRVHFDDANLPVGTSILTVSVSSPVDGFVVQSFKVTVIRAF